MRFLDDPHPHPPTSRPQVRRRSGALPSRPILVLYSTVRRSSRTLNYQSTKGLGLTPQSRSLPSPESLATMVRSLESSRPIMAPSLISQRTSKRFSTYSGVSSIAATVNTINSSATSSDPRLQEIKEWAQGLERLDSKRLQQQRYQPSAEKSDNLSKLALGAKVERALDRRMTSQDAILRPRVLSEKPALDRVNSVA
ncbi:MAG: hypothetical protein Q9187_000899 [Circinaria calcarea]